MKKRVHAIVLVIAMIFSMFGSVTFNVEEAKADTTVKIKFHYKSLPFSAFYVTSNINC